MERHLRAHGDGVLDHRVRHHHDASAAPTEDSAVDHLFLGTDRFEYFTVEWDPERRQLRTIEAFTDPSEPHMRESQSQNKCLVDESGRFMALLLWEGVISLVRMQLRKPTMNKLDWMDQVRVTELFIKAATFIPTETGHPKIAFLYQGQCQRRERQAAIYRMTSDDRDVVPSKFDPNKDRELDIVFQDSSRRCSSRSPSSRIRTSSGTTTGNRRGTTTAGRSHCCRRDTHLLHRRPHQTSVSITLQTPVIFVAFAECDVCHYFLADDYGGLHF